MYTEKKSIWLNANREEKYEKTLGIKFVVNITEKKVTDIEWTPHTISILLAQMKQKEKWNAFHAEVIR